jgi:hypothetical protein
MPTHIAVVFFDPVTNRGIGPVRRVRSEEILMEKLRRAHANLETLNIVEHALSERRPVMIDLDLTEEQFRKLRG